MRPVAIASTLLRLFHKIFVNMLNSKIKLSDFQFGLRPVDGVVRGIDLLDSALRSVQVYFKLISIAVFDLEKVFDSVSH